MSPFRSKSGRQPIIKVQLRWIMPKPIPEAVALCFGLTWRPIPLYVRPEKTA